MRKGQEEALVRAIKKAKTKKEKDTATSEALDALEYLVHSTIRIRFDTLPSGVDREDLVQDGKLALLRCFKEYEPSKGEFHTYAITVLSNALTTSACGLSWSWPGRVEQWKLNKVRNELTTVLEREPSIEDMAGALGIDVESMAKSINLSMKNDPAYLSDAKIKDNKGTSRPVGEVLPSDKLSVEDTTELRICSDHILEALNTLPEDWKTAVLMSSQGSTYSEISKILGVCSQRVGQIILDAKNKVKSWFIENNMQDIIPEFVKCTDPSTPSHRVSRSKRKM